MSNPSDEDSTKELKRSSEDADHQENTADTDSSEKVNDADRPDDDVDTDSDTEPRLLEDELLGDVEGRENPSNQSYEALPPEVRIARLVKVLVIPGILLIIALVVHHTHVASGVTSLVIVATSFILLGLWVGYIFVKGVYLLPGPPPEAPRDLVPIELSFFAQKKLSEQPRVKSNEEIERIEAGEEIDEIPYQEARLDITMLPEMAGVQSVVLFLYANFLLFFGPPVFASLASAVGVWALLILGLPLAAIVVWWYPGWARWYFYRLVTTHIRVISIDDPPLLDGTTFPVDLVEIRMERPATERFWESWIGTGNVHLDTLVAEDEPIRKLGRFRNPEIIIMTIRVARVIARAKQVRRSDGTERG